MTGVPGALGHTDTIVQRLDDAVFNKKGVAETRIQVRALSLRSSQPVKTSCGLFRAEVALDGEQPITQMRIVRDNAKGGRFMTPLALNVKISFNLIGHPEAEPLEIRKSVRFPAISQSWVSPPARVKPQNEGFVLVDTDGDRTPDTYLPGNSNFSKSQCGRCDGFWPEPPQVVCHEGDGCEHCVCCL